MTQKIFENDPFAKLDQTGVGKLMEMAIKLGKPVNPEPSHAVSAASTAATRHAVEFCHKIGLGLCILLTVSVFRSQDLLLHRLAIAEKNA